MKSLYVVLALLAAGTAHAAIYKCKTAGELRFTDEPCAHGKRIDKHSTKTPPSQFQAYVPPAEPKLNNAADVMLYFGTDEFDHELSRFMADAKAVDEVSKYRAEHCLDIFRQIFKDPRSAYVVDHQLYQRGAKERFVKVDVSARNGFGGAARSTIICDTPSD